MPLSIKRDFTFGNGEKKIMAEVLFYTVYFLFVLIVQSFSNYQISSSETNPENTSVSLSGFKWTSSEHLPGDDSWEGFESQETSTPSWESVSQPTQSVSTTEESGNVENPLNLAIDTIIISVLFVCSVLIIIFQRSLRNMCLRLKLFRNCQQSCGECQEPDAQVAEFELNEWRSPRATLEWNSNTSSSEDTDVTEES